MGRWIPFLCFRSGLPSGCRGLRLTDLSVTPALGPNVFKQTLNWPVWSPRIRVEGPEQVASVFVLGTLHPHFSTRRKQAPICSADKGFGGFEQLQMVCPSKDKMEPTEDAIKKDLYSRKYFSFSRAVENMQKFFYMLSVAPVASIYRTKGLRA